MIVNIILSIVLIILIILVASMVYSCDCKDKYRTEMPQKYQKLGEGHGTVMSGFDTRIPYDSYSDGVYGNTSLTMNRLQSTWHH